MVDWRDKEAQNEATFRDMNEWTLEENDARSGPAPETDLYLCECSDRRCTDPIRLTRAEYEAIRAEPIRFAIAVNHENPEIDRVLQENARYATVEKIHPGGLRIARATDPRR